MPSWKAILATPGSESLETWDCEEGIETNAASWCCVEITCRTFSDWDFWEGQCSQTNAVKMKCVIKLAWPLKTIPSVIPTLAPTVQTLQADCAQGNGKNKRRKYHAFKKKEEAAQQHSTNTRNPNPVGKPAQRCLCHALIYINWLWRPHERSSTSRIIAKAHAAHRKSKPLSRGMASLQPWRAHWLLWGSKGNQY